MSESVHTACCQARTEALQNAVFAVKFVTAHIHEGKGDISPKFATDVGKALALPCDCARLTALRRVVEISSDLCTQQQPMKHNRRGKDGALCDWCGHGWPCDVAELRDALSQVERGESR